MHFNRLTNTSASIIIILTPGSLLSQTISQDQKIKVIQKSEIKTQAVDLHSFPDIIHPRKFSEVIPHIYSLKSTPLSVSIHVGEEFSMSSLRIQALDKEQNIIGTLIAYNSYFKPGAYKLSGPMLITGTTPGNGEIVITPPFAKTLITDRPIPELRIIVTVIE